MVAGRLDLKGSLRLLCAPERAACNGLLSSSSDATGPMTRGLRDMQGSQAPPLSDGAVHLLGT